VSPFFLAIIALILSCSGAGSQLWAHSFSDSLLGDQVSAVIIILSFQIEFWYLHSQSTINKNTSKTLALYPANLLVLA
jgi:hypothetical protein